MMSWHILAASVGSIFPLNDAFNAQVHVGFLKETSSHGAVTGLLDSLPYLMEELVGVSNWTLSIRVCNDDVGEMIGLTASCK